MIKQIYINKETGKEYELVTTPRYEFIHGLAGRGLQIGWDIELKPIPENVMPEILPGDYFLFNDTSYWHYFFASEPNFSRQNVKCIYRNGIKIWEARK